MKKHDLDKLNHNDDLFERMAGRSLGELGEFHPTSYRKGRRGEPSGKTLKWNSRKMV